MQETEQCIIHYLRLKRLLEDELYEINYSIGGDMLNGYNTVLEREIELVENAIEKLKVFDNYWR